MNTECCQPILPNPLQLDEGHVFPLQYTVNYFDVHVFYTTCSKMDPQISRPVLNLIPVSTMSCVHEVDGFPCVLLATQATGYQG